MKLCLRKPLYNSVMLHLAITVQGQLLFEGAGPTSNRENMAIVDVHQHTR